MLGRYSPNALILARLSGVITRNLIAPNLPFLLPEPDDPMRMGSKPLLSFSLKALETELELQRSKISKLSVSPKEKRSRYFDTFAKLLPKEKLQVR